MARRSRHWSSSLTLPDSFVCFSAAATAMLQVFKASVGSSDADLRPHAICLGQFQEITRLFRRFDCPRVVIETYGCIELEKGLSGLICKLRHFTQVAGLFCDSDGLAISFHGPLGIAAARQAFGAVCEGLHGQIHFIRLEAEFHDLVKLGWKLPVFFLRDPGTAVPDKCSRLLFPVVYFGCERQGNFAQCPSRICEEMAQFHSTCGEHRVRLLPRTAG